MNIKRTLSAFLALLFILASFPLTAFAEDIDGEGNAGAGAGGGAIDSTSTWNDGKQGYRFVIADQNLQPISNIVDITFLDPSTQAEEGYFNSRLTPLSTDKGRLGYDLYTVDEVIANAENTYKQTGDPAVKIDAPPPAAIGWPGNDPIAQGLAFKDWFMGTDDFLGGFTPPEHSGGGGGNGNSGGNNNGGGGTGGWDDPFDTPEINDRYEAMEQAGRDAESLTKSMNKLLAQYYTKIATYKGSLAAGKLTLSGYIGKLNSEELSPTKLKGAIEGLVQGQIDMYYRTQAYDDDYLRILVDELNKLLFPVINGLAAAYTARLGTEISIAWTLPGANNHNNTSPAAQAFNPGGDKKLVSFTPQQQPTVSTLQFSGRDFLPIPLAEDNTPPAEDSATENPKSHYAQLLNMKLADGTYLFKLDGATITADHTNVAEIKEKDYIIIVEPILWFKPTGAKLNGKKWVLDPSNIYEKYVYGTIGNIAQWYNTPNGGNNTKYGGSSDGGWFAAIMGQVGWQCMVTDSGWVSKVDPSKKIEPATGTGEHSYIKIANMQQKISANEGISMHVYTASSLVTSGSGTHTWDNPIDIPHPAPPPPTPPAVPPDDPNDPDAPPAVTQTSNINIIKCYEDSGKHIETHTRTNNPSSILIEDEPVYKVVGWVVSSKFTAPSITTPYEVAIQNIPTTQSGTTPQQIAVNTPETTLYIKLIKSNLQPAPNDLTIHESEVAKSIQTIDPIINEKGIKWGPKTWTYTSSYLYLNIKNGKH